MSDAVKRYHFNDGSGSSAEPGMYKSTSGEYVLASDHDRVVADKNSNDQDYLKLSALHSEQRALIASQAAEIAKLEEELHFTMGQRDDMVQKAAQLMGDLATARADAKVLRAVIEKLRDQRNECILKTERWPTTDAIADHYEEEITAIESRGADKGKA